MNVSGGGQSGGGPSQDFDLNLAPIIDCFTVLITFMLASASFLSIGVFEAAVGGLSNASEVKAPPETVQVELKEQHEILIKLSGQVNKTIPIQAVGDSWNFDALVSEITSVKGKWPQVDSLVLSASNEVEYLHVIKTMERLRKVIPAIVLGGF